MKRFLKEFQEFAIKGNSIDLAIGVVIGTAFGKITTSLVEDIINPIIGFLFGNIDFSDKAIILRQAIGDAPEVAIRYGALITVLLNFFLVGLALFILVKQINKLRARFAEDEKDIAKRSEPKEEVVLLRDIKNILEKQS